MRLTGYCGKKKIINKCFENLEKNCKFYQKTSKSWRLKCWNKSIETKNHAIFFFTRSWNMFFLHLRNDEYQKLTKTLGSPKKLQILSKISKIRDIGMLKTIPLLLETIQCPIRFPKSFLSDRGICFFALEKWRISKTDKNFRKPRKNCRFYQKIQKFETLKC